MNNKWIYHFYAPIEYSLYILAFSSWIENVRLRNLLRHSIYVLTSVFIISSLITWDLHEFNYSPVTVAYIIYDGLAAITLYQIFKGDLGGIFKQYKFWIASALMLLSSCNLIYFAFNSFINAVIPEYSTLFWVIHNIINMIAYLFFAIGLICYRRNSSTDLDFDIDPGPEMSMTGSRS